MFSCFEFAVTASINAVQTVGDQAFLYSFAVRYVSSKTDELDKRGRLVSWGYGRATDDCGRNLRAS